MVLFWRRKQAPAVEAKERISIELLEVNELEWDIGKGSIRYNFSIKGLPKPIVSVNRKLEITFKGVVRRKPRNVVEKDLGWATLKTLYLKERAERVEGHVEGQPEDFTLSKLGVRFGRALLKDELVWHPICEDHLVSWGLQGHISEYRITVRRREADYLAPGEESREGLAITYTSTPRLRLPGITIIGGLKRADKGDYTYGLHTSIELEYAEKAMNTVINEILPSINEILPEVQVPTYSKLALLWNDIEPLASDDLIGLRRGTVKALVRGEPRSLHEAAHMVATHVVYNYILARLDDYWMLEGLPQAIALLVVDRLRGREAVRESLKIFKDCIDYGGGEAKIPSIRSIRVPKSLPERIAASCRPPLVFWGLASQGGRELLTTVLQCVLQKNYYSYQDLGQCLNEALGSKAKEFIDLYIEGRNIPRLVT